METANTPTLLSAVTLDSGRSDNRVITASQSSQVEHGLPQPADVSHSELLSWLGVRKRSADYHLKEYLQFKEIWKQELEKADKQSGNTTKDIAPMDCSSGARTQTYWNMIVERDALIADLNTMENILEEIREYTAEKSQWKGMPPISFALCGYGLLSMVTGMGGISSALAILVGLYAPIKCIVKDGIVRDCKSKTTFIKKLAERESESPDTKRLTMPQFKLLHWMNGRDAATS